MVRAFAQTLNSKPWNLPQADILLQLARPCAAIRASWTKGQQDHADAGFLVQGVGSRDADLTISDRNAGARLLNGAVAILSLKAAS